MRFDEVSVRYGEFGDFYIGMLLPLDELFRRLCLCPPRARATNPLILPKVPCDRSGGLALLRPPDLCPRQPLPVFPR